MEKLETLKKSYINRRVHATFTKIFIRFQLRSFLFFSFRRFILVEQRWRRANIKTTPGKEKNHSRNNGTKKGRNEKRARNISTEFPFQWREKSVWTRLWSERNNRRKKSSRRRTGQTTELIVHFYLRTFSHLLVFRFDKFWLLWHLPVPTNPFWTTFGFVSRVHWPTNALFIQLNSFESLIQPSNHQIVIES